jgi:DNA replication protein DnaC
VLMTPTLDKLNALGLTGMAAALIDQQGSPAHQGLPFEDRLGLLVDREAQERDNRRLQRLLKAAKLRASACVEDVDFRHPRGLDRSQLLSLATAASVEAHQSCLIVGPTGVGKTYLACALAHAAIRRGHSALYLRAPRMLTELAAARADGRLPRVMASWARVAVLLIDDLALRPVTAEQAADLLEVIEDRAQLRSTIVTSQLPVALWHEALGEPTIADAILDRLLQGAHRIELRGDSLRLPPEGASRSSHEGQTPAEEAPAPAPKARRGATKGARRP